MSAYGEITEGLSPKQRRQFERELAEWEEAQRVYRLRYQSEPNKSGHEAMAKLGRHWTRLIADELDREVDRRRSTSGPRPMWMRLDMSTEEMAAITLSVILDNLAARDGGRTLGVLVKTIGYGIVGHLKLKMFKAKTPAVYREYVKRLKKANATSGHANRVLKHGAGKYGVYLPYSSDQINTIALTLFHAARRALGSRLIVEDRPVSYDQLRRMRSRAKTAAMSRPKVVRLDDETLAHIRSSLGRLAATQRNPGPMVCEPLSWEETNGEGGYLLAQGRIQTAVRNGKGASARAVRRLAKEAPPTAVYRALDRLGSTCLQINDRVLSIAEEALSRNLRLPGIPSHAQLMALPEKPADIDTNEEARRNYRRLRARAEEHNYGIRNQQVADTMALGMARELVSEPELYFPHSADFRGRMYPISSRLNPQGSDLRRALFRFKESRLASDDDMALSLAALVKGCGQMSYRQRINHVLSKRDAFRTLAVDPLGHFNLAVELAGSDKAWQLIAACDGFTEWELTKECRVPTYIDGTCNGLQHFAALARDPEMAAAVNLSIPMGGSLDAPRDIYTDVGLQVLGKLARTKDRNGRLWTEALAHHGIDARKLAKVPVMTYAYGATAIANQQQLGSLFSDLSPWWRTEQEQWAALVWLTKIFRNTMLQYVRPAEGITLWLRHMVTCVYDYGFPNQHRIDWTTPSGWPWSLHYGDFIKKRASSRFMGENIGVAWLERSKDGRPRKRDMLTSISPNFIQALDAAAMAYAVNEFEGPCIAIHDALGVRPGELAKAHKAVRRGFLTVHGGTCPLVSFHRAIKEQIPARNHHLIPSPPPAGDYDVAEVLAAPYFFN